MHRQLGGQAELLAEMRLHPTAYFSDNGMGTGCLIVEDEKEDDGFKTVSDLYAMCCLYKLLESDHAVVSIKSPSLYILAETKTEETP